MEREEKRRENNRIALTAALPYMPNGVITDEAVEAMAKSYGDTHYLGGWNRIQYRSSVAHHENARKALEAAAPHMGIKLNRKASIRNMFNEMGEKLFNTADRISETRDNIEETVAGGVNLIAERHEKPIPEEIGGNTVTWSDLNPFKSPFKNGKLR